MICRRPVRPELAHIGVQTGCNSQRVLSMYGSGHTFPDDCPGQVKGWSNQTADSRKDPESWWDGSATLQDPLTALYVEAKGWRKINTRQRWSLHEGDGWSTPYDSCQHLVNSSKSTLRQTVSTTPLC